MAIITPMREIQPQIDRMLTLLRNKIHERGFTQMEVQEPLGWGRSYISQLVTKTKSLRLEQVLAILDVIGVEPAEFFSELYGSHGWGLADSWSRPPSRPAAKPDPELAEQLEGLRSLLRGLVDCLLDKGLIDADEVTETVKSFDAER